MLFLPDINPEALVRPHGDVDVLIGACDACLLPFRGTRAGDLRLEDTIWGCGQVLQGFHPSLPLTATPQLTKAAMVASRASPIQIQGKKAYQAGTVPQTSSPILKHHPGRGYKDHRSTYVLEQVEEGDPGSVFLRIHGEGNTVGNIDGLPSTNRLDSQQYYQGFQGGRGYPGSRKIYRGLQTAKTTEAVILVSEED